MPQNAVRLPGGKIPKLTFRRTMEKPHGHTRRILRPDLKRRRPPLACIQCYSRKIKCSRESPACGRCIRAGKGHECAYRNEPSDDHPPAQSRPSPRPLVTGPTHDGATSPKHTRYLAPRSVEGRMAHLKGPETSTKFYGFSYPLNLYQQVHNSTSRDRCNTSEGKAGTNKNHSFLSSDATSQRSRTSIRPSTSSGTRSMGRQPVWDHGNSNARAN